MPNPQTPISDREFDKLIMSRDVMEAQDKIWLFDKIIDVPLVQNHTTYNGNPGVRKAGIHFRNCTFNQKITLGQQNEVGSITFEGCLFEDDFASYSFSSVNLIGDCIFKKGFVISSNEGMLTLKDLNVEGTLNVSASSNQLLVLKDINIGKEIKKQKVVVSASSGHTEMENIFCDEMIVTSIAQKGLNTLNNLKCKRLLLNGPWRGTKIDLKNLNLNELILQNISN
jgi:hypothetical protein